MKKLKIILRSSSGRNNLGRLTLFTKGGGLKKYTHLLDFRRKLVDMQCKVRKIEYAANRSARVCLICSKNGVLSYVTATKGIKVGDVLFSSKKNFLYKNGDNISLKFVQIGSMVHNVELYPGAGAVFCRSAGSFAKV